MTVQPIIGKRILDGAEVGEEVLFLDAENMLILDENESLVRELNKDDFINCVLMARAKLLNGPEIMGIGDSVSIKGGALASQPWAAGHDNKYAELKTRYIVIVEVGRRHEDALPEFVFMMYYKEQPKISVL